MAWRRAGNVSVCRRKQPHTSPVAWPSPHSGQVKERRSPSFKGAPFAFSTLRPLSRGGARSWRCATFRRRVPFRRFVPFQGASFSRCRKRSNLLGFVPAPEWRNGRRGGLKNHWLTPCGFESHLRHQLHAKGTRSGSLFFSQWPQVSARLFRPRKLPGSGRTISVFGRMA